MRFWLITLLIATAPPLIAEDRPTAEQLEFFEQKIRPALVQNCHECHSSKKQEGGLRLDSREFILKGGDTGPAVVPGMPQAGELIAALHYEADGYQMPPAGKLSAEVIADLTRWVEMGAPWPAEEAETAPGGREFNIRQRAESHWAFQPVRPVTPPAVRDLAWTSAPVDRFILAKLEENRLEPAATADRRTLLRRVTLDLTGLPPTPDEMQAFLDDPSPAAWETVVDRLLASPRYGERWGRHWLDLVRFAETSGHEFDYDIPHAWPYRDYVIRAFNEDLPYDQLAREHIAGDLFAQPRRGSTGENESVQATAFYWFAQGKHSPVDIRAEEIDTVENQIDVLSKTFLGLTVSCARCHDHKFDPISTRDYYALAGFLQSSRQQSAIINDPAPFTARMEDIQALRQAQRNLWTAATVAQLQPEADRLAESLQQPATWIQKLEQAAGDPAHPLFPWFQLRRVTDESRFVQRREELHRQVQDRLRQATELPAEVLELESFDTPEALQDWFVTGFAFQPGLSAVGDFEAGSAEQPIQRLIPPGLAHSGLVSPKLEGALRSPTFVIEKRLIHLQLSRIGGHPQPGRQLKNGQVHLILDGFQHIKSPLWGHLSLIVRNDGQPGWYTIDVNKLQGRRAYLEFEDGDHGALLVDRVLFSDGGVPAPAPNALILNLLADDSITSPVALAAAYQTAFRSALGQWSSDKLNDESAAAIPLLNLLLENAPRAEVPAAQRQPVIDSLAEYQQLRDAFPATVRSIALTDGTPENEQVLVRGNHKKPGELVPRRFLEVFQTQPVSTEFVGSGRLQLAEDLTAADNPLFARVLVNRLWQHHFGRGIVPTPDNFGKLGQSPSHPELLDYLAGELVRRGWSMKALHRELLLSSTYRMSSRATDDDAETRDPDNLLLHRMNVKRLEAEAIRDSLLALSGRLDGRLYGPSVLPFLTEFMQGRGRPQTGPLDGDGRRSIYINVRRNFLTPMFLAFDYPTPLSTMGRRSVSNVPAQALTLMNNPFVQQQARQWADRMLASTPGAETLTRVESLYQTAYGRLPSAEESATALEFLAIQGQEYGHPDDPRTWADLCHVLINLKEFVYIP